MEDKIVSNIVIDWHNMFVKPFIHIALDYKWPSNYYAT